MKISTKGRYAVRALLEMADQSTEKPLLLSQIARQQAIPERYLIQIFGSLRKAGLIISYRGAKGGFQLARPPKEITLGDILEAAEGPIRLLDCLQEKGAGCGRLNDCAARQIWEKVNRDVAAVFQKTTLADMQALFREEREMIEGNYSI